MAACNPIQPVPLVQDAAFELRLYDPHFKEFVVYSVIMTGNPAAEKVIRFKNWAILIVIKGSANIVAIREAKVVKVTQYSTWLLEPAEFALATDVPFEAYIATENTLL